LKNRTVKKLKHKSIKQNKAFSLIELSIVLLIISILASSALSISTNSIINNKIKVTNDRINQLYKAIGNFLVINGRIPCPASLIKNKINDPNYGKEVGAGANCAGSGVYQSTDNANLVMGAIPVKELGLATEMGEDGFESKFTYMIDKNFANKSNFGISEYEGIITVVEKMGGANQISTSDAILSIISHGSNKFSAFSSKTGEQNIRSTDIDEMENDVGLISGETSNFNNSIISTSNNSDIFDDILFYKTRNQLVQDFSAFNLIPCQATTTTISGFNWPLANHGEIAQATTGCSVNAIKPTKRCGFFGIWEEGLISSCP